MNPALKRFNGGKLGYIYERSSDFFRKRHTAITFCRDTYDAFLPNVKNMEQMTELSVATHHFSSQLDINTPILELRTTA